MSSAKDKAKELVDKFRPISMWHLDSDTRKVTWSGKECALLCVDEIIECLYKERMLGGEWFLQVEADNYWQEVKSEIENYEN